VINRRLYTPDETGSKNFIKIPLNRSNGGLYLRIGLVLVFILLSISLIASALADENSKLKWDKNGHYYEIVKIALNWDDAQSYARSQQFIDPDTGFVLKGHLATIASSEENSWIVQNIILPLNLAPINGEWFAVWLGGYRDKNAINASDGWHWITGEPWAWTNWHPDEPNNAGGMERYLQMWAIDSNGETMGKWNDNDIQARLVINYILIEYEPTEEQTTETPSCNSIIYLNGESAACVEAEVINKVLSIKISPKEGWGVPNRASLVEMMGLKLKPVPVGEIRLGYDENVSVSLKDTSIWYNYIDKGAYAVSEETSELPEFIAPLIGDLEGCGHFWFPIGSAQSMLWNGFTDSSYKPTNDYFTNENEYDNCILSWPDQPVKFSGDVIDKAYVDYPNNILLRIPVGIDAGSEGKDIKIHIYVKLLLTKLHNYAGAVVGDYSGSTYANCNEFEIPIK
jgi:hypothetical protein